MKRCYINEEFIVDEAAKVFNKNLSSVFILEDPSNIPEPKQTLLAIGKGLTQIMSTKENVAEQLKRLKLPRV